VSSTDIVILPFHLATARYALFVSPDPSPNAGVRGQEENQRHDGSTHE